jgi:PhzF family phenazine biosynthesis protein
LIVSTNLFNIYPSENQNKTINFAFFLEIYPGFIVMKKLTVYQVDAFTKEKFKGNPAGVVINADGLNDSQMQQIARELNNSETAFLFAPDDKSCDGVIRYFTPKIEVPTCGHATIAAMYAKAVEEKLDPCVLRIKTRIGVLPFEIVRNKGDYRAIMTQGKFELGDMLTQNRKEQLLNALGLRTKDLNEECPVQIVSAGHSKIMTGIKSRKKLNELTPDYSALIALSAQTGCNGFFVFTFDSNLKEVLTYGRMFAPAIGINEDPVTGNANGPLGGYLVKNNLASYKNNLFEFIGRQGEQINRLGEVKVRVRIENNEPSVIQIEGDAVVLFKTEIQL